MTSIGGQNHPVEGSRFSKTDLDPAITDDNISSLESALSNIENVDKVSVNLLSATLRVHIDLVDSATDDVASAAIDSAYNIVNEQLPIDTYFTNKDGSKMYDLEIDSYNYLIDDTHTADGGQMATLHPLHNALPQKTSIRQILMNRKKACIKAIHAFLIAIKKM